MQRPLGPSALALSLAVLLLGTSVAPEPVTAQHQHPSPYAGHEAMEISSLSPDELRELRTGEGMGLARAAELNHFPGPKHALELQAELALSSDQVGGLTEIRRVTLEQAIEMGEEIITAERELTELFRGGTPDDSGVTTLTARLGAMYGELRAVHLIAHLRTVELMTPEQVGDYDRLRGYVR